MMIWQLMKLEQIEKVHFNIFVAIHQGTSLHRKCEQVVKKKTTRET